MTEIRIIDVEPVILASVRRQAHAQTIGQLIANSGVWEMMKAQGVQSPGRNVVVYWASPGSRLTSPGGIPVDIGADVREPFRARGDLRCIKTPSGRALHTRHIGAYERLGESYARLAEWARTKGLSIEGPYWEIYGHWNANADLLETDLYHLIV